MENESNGYDSTRTRPRYGQKHTKYKTCNDYGFVQYTLSTQHLKRNS